MRIVILCLAWLLSGLSASAETRTFKEWQVQCDEALYCSATSIRNLAPDGLPFSLAIARHAQRSYWEISLDTAAAPAEDWGDFVIAVDAASLTLSGRREVGAYGTPARFYFLGDKAQALLDQLVPGSSVRFDFNDRAGTARSARFALSGLSAALLYIDETQARLGSERVASAPPHGLTPAGSEQVATPAVPAFLLERLAADPECSPLHELANGRDIHSGRLDDSHEIYILPCWSGAYNFGSKIFVGSGDDFEQLAFADYSDDLGWTGSTTLVNVDYDDTDKTLHTFNKGRGLGDCGSIGTWQWAGYGFRLLEFRAKGTCDDGGAEDVEPGDFPLIFSADPQRVPADRRTVPVAPATARS